jgi:L-alanine-DL-glutamate epimerase-like enolase superfamily enzyme
MFAGVVAQAIGALENALLDAKAKILGVPCYDLFGGKLRDKIRVYWSHCGPWRMPPRAKFYNSDEIRTLEDVKALGEEAKEKGYTALKTYPFQEDSDGRMLMWSPGFGNPFQPDLNIDKNFLKNLRDYLEAFRDGAGPDMDILLDLNFNVRTEGILKIIQELKSFDLFWLEIDHHNPQSLAYVRNKSPFPIASCETLLSGQQYLPYLQAQSMDVVIVDAVWNGVWQSLKITSLANTYDINVAPHNFYGHLATMMNAHFSAAIPNFRILETDIDRLSSDEELFPTPPLIEDSYLILPTTPGWGCDPDEDVLRSRATK